ncbi:MAG: hypothetical protein QOH62_2412, partial [Solirubrobacteraceae bacterium]|nr:hypothetical protein [Solirubrobacteraceae bacterium]
NSLFANGFNTFTRFLRGIGKDVPDLPSGR